MTTATEVYITATHNHACRFNLDRSMARLARARRDGDYDPDAAVRLLRGNARQACKAHGVTCTPGLISAVVRLMMQSTQIED